MEKVDTKRKKSSPRNKSLVEVEECPVCFENFATDNFVVCSCTSKTCRECTKEYILSTFQVAHCMTCRVEWTNKFLATIFTKKWLDDNTDKGYRNHRKKCALDREKAMLPETLLNVPLVTAEKEKAELLASLRLRNKNIKGEIEDIKMCLQNGVTYKKYLIEQEIKKLERELSIPNIPSKRYSDITKTLMNLSKKNYCSNPTVSDLIEDRDKIKELENEILTNKKQILKASGTSGIFVDEYHAKFICACPYQYCRGMIVAKKLSCIVCKNSVCGDCREPLGNPIQTKSTERATHVCNTQILENIKLLNEDTRPCPKCAAGIFRISGCSQMFCTNCKISFSWETGKINDGNIHNPHAIEWYRNNGTLTRDPQDVPCGGLPQVFQIAKYDEISDDMFETIISIYQTVVEIDEKIQKCTIEEFEDIRMDYVLGKKTEKQWESAIFTRERNNERKKVLSDIYATFRTISIERIQLLYEELTNYRSVRDIAEQSNDPIKLSVKLFIDDMNEIKTFINSTLSEELMLLGTTKPLQILDCWQWSNK